MVSLVFAEHVPGVYIAARNLLSASVGHGHVTNDDVDQWDFEDVLFQPITKMHCLRRKMRMVRTCHWSWRGQMRFGCQKKIPRWDDLGRLFLNVSVLFFFFFQKIHAVDNGKLHFVPLYFSLKYHFILFTFNYFIRFLSYLSQVSMRPLYWFFVQLKAIWPFSVIY